MKLKLYLTKSFNFFIVKFNLSIQHAFADIQQIYSRVENTLYKYRWTHDAHQSQLTQGHKLYLEELGREILYFLAENK